MHTNGAPTHGAPLVFSNGAPHVQCAISVHIGYSCFCSSATATSMAKYLQQSEKVAILPEGVAREYIELLLWAMEQTDSPNPIVRERWWEYRSQMEHPPEIEGSSIYRVPFVRVSCQSEPVESSSTKPNFKRRKVVGSTMLHCHPLPRHSHRLTGRLCAAGE